MAWSKRPSRWAERGPRVVFTPQERAQILGRAGHRCYVYDPDLCRGRATEVDHVIPVAEGGPHTLANASAICWPCHDKKSREEAARGYERRQAKLHLPREPHPFFDMEA